MSEMISKPLSEPMTFSVVRVPFFLEPSYPEDETFQESHFERMHKKWGGPTAYEKIRRSHRLDERGAEVGICFNTERVVSNTLASHRLVQWVSRSRGLDASERLYDHLNHLHFIEGRKLNDVQLLSEAAEVVGVDRADAADFLSGGAGADTIRKVVDAVHAMNIHSIPTWVIDGQYVLSGACPAQDLVDIFRKIETSGRVSGKGVFHDLLGIPSEFVMPGPQPVVE